MGVSLEDDIYAQHVIEGGFLWLLRDVATRDPAYDLRRLATLDERVEAHLDGLRLAGDRGWAHAEGALKDGEAGEMFVAGVLAIAREDIEGIARILDAIQGSAAHARGLASAFGWSPLASVQSMMPALLDLNCPAELHWLGVSACAVHRDDPGPVLSLHAGSEDLRVRARALRAAGQLGRLDLLPALTAELRSSDDELRYAAAWSSTLLGNPTGLEVLVAFASKDGPHTEDAADLAARALEHSAALRLIQDLGRAPQTLRGAIRGAMALGDPALVPWLLDLASNEEVARLAAWAVVSILGLDLVTLRARKAPLPGLRFQPVDADGHDVAMDPDENLDWPDAERLKAAWQSEQSKLRRGTRYLLGAEMLPDRLRHALRTGVQPVRRGAALEIAVRSPGRPLAATSGPGFLQLAGQS